MEKLTKEQVINVYNSEEWKNWTDEEIVKFQLFQDKLAAKLIIEHGKRHMGESDKITELPNVLDVILKMSGISE